MDSSLALTALLMGLAGGPHCVAMCGAACGALGRTATFSPAVRIFPTAVARPPALFSGISPALWVFQLGRLLSYSALGAVAAGGMQAVGWLSVHAAALRPLWTLTHVAAALLGLALLWQARQPAWLEEGGLRLWRVLQSRLNPAGAPAGSARTSRLAGALGLAWGLMPCGLLYSALLVAALSPGWWQGALVMLLFALGSGLSLLAGPWLWQRLRGGSGAWAVRLAGAALLALSVWALWMGLVHDTAPWCVSPALPPS